MKTIVKVILPVLAFTLASAAAVSTNEAKIRESKKTVLITGFIQNPNQSNCLPASVDCTIVNTGEACMSNEATPRQVWKKNGANACADNLYKVIE